MNKLLNHLWQQIFRYKRYFCAELFQIINANPVPFINLLKDKGIEILKDKVEIGYEVCFYRDYIFTNSATKVLAKSKK